MSITINEVNKLTRREFNVRFSNIIENCPDCAEYIEKHRPFSSVEHLHSNVCNFLDSTNDSQCRRMIQGFPDVAGRIAQLGLLGPESTKEHANAGLFTLTKEEVAFLSILNRRYKEKFGFPFIICARENKRDTIIEGISGRVHNTVERELFQAVEQVKKISWYRILDLVEDSNENSFYSI